MPVNTQRKNARYGQQYKVVSAPGGVFHVYANGAKVFVPKAATKPAGAGGPAPVPAAPAAPTPYAPDAQYYADTAGDTFARQQKASELTQQSAYAKTDLQEALRRMTDKQPKDIQASRESANRSNLFYSGHQGQVEGDINTGYERQRSDTQQNYDRGEAARLAARRALEAGKSIEEAARLAQSIDRQTVRDTGAADAGVLAPNPAPPASTRVATAKTGINPKTGKKYRIVKVRGRTYHYYADGRRVPV